MNNIKSTYYFKVFIWGEKYWASIKFSYRKTCSSYLFTCTHSLFLNWKLNRDTKKKDTGTHAHQLIIHDTNKAEGLNSHE